MSFVEKTGETVLDLAKNEGIQEKVTGLIGMLCPYLKLRKEAIDLYAEEIKNSDLSTEAKVAALLGTKKTIKKLKNQKKIADIAAINAKEGTDFSENSNVDEEWFDRFMEAAGFVSSEEMQLVWGKILAREFELPGSTPRNMTRILSEFTKSYAEAFRKICDMGVLLIEIDEEHRIVSTTQRIVVPYTGNSDYMHSLGLTFEMMNELETIGVIKFDTIAGFVITNITAKKVLIHVSGRIIEIDEYKDEQVPIGNVIFTEAGEALQKITDFNEIKEYDYSEALVKYYKTQRVTLAEDANYNIEVIDGKIKMTKKTSDL